MPKGPKGEKRPADVIGAAVKVMKIATGEIEEDIDGDGKDKAAVALGRKGGAARAKKPDDSKNTYVTGLRRLGKNTGKARKKKKR